MLPIYYVVTSIMFCSATEAIKSRYIHAMPKTEYFAHSKDRTNELSSGLTQINSLLLDLTKESDRILTKTENNLKTFIVNQDSQIINDLRRRSVELGTLFKLLNHRLKDQLEDLAMRQRSDFEIVDKHLDHIRKEAQATTDVLKKGQMLILSNLDGLKDLLSRAYVDLKHILRSTDLGSTDTNSLGKQILDMANILSTIEDSLGVIDQRLPGFDDNGELIVNKLTHNFEILNKRLPNLIGWDKHLEDINTKLDEVAKQLSSHSYPSIDNHIPNAGNVFTMVNSEDDFVKTEL
ncbi:hypothetical protein CCFV1_ORF073 [Cotesia congregata filamentous virus 1]|uniref:Uncharacterized protein n=1 Tax=Cotesia congregata filamentous virus 1 TaxID=3064291 RepID=A0ABC8QKR0_9VIRU|nr:hypothetical protein CCFV1_ORF073 [Cotesia congregata filamentous virus 1]